jgi:hypothetical protein
MIIFNAVSRSAQKSASVRVVTWAPEKLVLLPLPVSPLFPPDPDLPGFCWLSLSVAEPLLWAWLT